jgi:hypothetical protein
MTTRVWSALLHAGQYGPAHAGQRWEHGIDNHAKPLQIFDTPPRKRTDQRPLHNVLGRSNMYQPEGYIWGYQPGCLDGSNLTDEPQDPGMAWRGQFLRCIDSSTSTGYRSIGVHQGKPSQIGPAQGR